VRKGRKEWKDRNEGKTLKGLAVIHTHTHALVSHFKVNVFTQMG